MQILEWLYRSCVSLLPTGQERSYPGRHDCLGGAFNFGSMEDTVFCGVFDGHGPYGHVIAKRVWDLLPLKFGSHLESYLSYEEVLKEISLNTADRMTSDSLVQISANGESRVYNKDQDMVQMLLTSIVKAYRFMDKELKMQVDFDCFCCGTTAVTMVKQGQHLVAGNIGDSRAVLGTRNKEDKLVPFQLTEDLKPDVPAEAARIKRCGGRIFALRDEPGVARLWLPNHNSPGLAMARAFGDFCLKDFGLISVSDVSYRRLTEKDEFVVLATDWIWDVLTNEEVVEIVAKAPTRCTAGRALVEAAVRNWRWKFPTSKVDDCAFASSLTRNQTNYQLLLSQWINTSAMALLNLIQHQRQLQAREPNHLSSMVSKSRQNRHTRDNQRVGR
ncbi:LOW QUALITY PROTEIN: hypothetical protein YC2023_049128 [Brassica napus]